SDLAGRVAAGADFRRRHPHLRKRRRSSEEQRRKESDLHGRLHHFCAVADCSSAWITAAMVASGCSSIIQWPEFLMITTVGLAEINLICAPSAAPLAFSPPIDATGIGSV